MLTGKVCFWGGLAKLTSGAGQDADFGLDLLATTLEPVLDEVQCWFGFFTFFSADGLVSIDGSAGGSDTWRHLKP